MAETLDGYLDEIRPLTVEERISFRGDLIAELQRLERDLHRAVVEDQDSNDPDQAPAIARRLLELQEELRASERPFVFASIGDTAWGKLRDLHQPTEAQIAAAGYRPDHDPDTFPVAAMAASLIDPDGVTEDGIRRLREKLNDGQWDVLWGACLAANRGVGTLPKSESASAVIRASEQKSAQQSNTPSP